MVMTMTSALARHRNDGENGEGEKPATAYPHIAMGSICLSPARIVRYEMAAVGGGPALGAGSGSYPIFIPAFPGAYP